MPLVRCGRALAVRHPVAAVAMLALLARVAFAVGSFLVHPVVLFSDEAAYVGLARWIADGRGAEAWSPDYGPALFRGTWAFTGPIVAVFWAIGPSRLAAQLVAVGFGAVAVALTYALARRLLGPRPAILVGGIAAILPSQVLWSSVVLRESAIWAALTLVALGLVEVRRSAGRRAWLGVVLTGLGLVGLVGLRSQTAVIAAWAVLGACLVLWRRPAQALSVAAFAVLLPLVAGLGPAGVDLVRAAAPTLGTTRMYLGLGADSAIDETTVFDRTGRPRRIQSDQVGALDIARRPGRSVVVDGQRRRAVTLPNGDVVLVDEGVDATLESLPKGVAAVLLRPAPWEATDGLGETMARVENVVWVALYLAAAAGAVLGRRRPELVMPVLLVLGTVGVGALTQGNIGTAFRHRAQILWALALLSGVAYEGWLGRRRPTTLT